MSIRGQDVGGDPIACDAFGYGLGQPAGILVLHYRTAGPLGFGAVRNDLVHQLYWSPDGMLSAVHGGRSWFTAPGEGFWAEQAVSHEVRAADRQTVYRICLREVPESLAGLRTGHVAIGPEAERLVQEIATPGYDERRALEARTRILRDLAPLTADIADECANGKGFARAVARAMSHNPADPTRLDEWAARLHISPKTLQRDFVREFGMSFTRRRTLLRLGVARALLVAEPVSVVARRVGYSSVSAFVLAFAKEYGCPPGQYARTRLATLA
ncbi:helix-turn-helix domain-containing protein [Embleya sp. NPDC127516]|uniref:AraC family transcriptional regulator n=1 Tax=Embleya sp. NPDC127516 TaxID=3363990 RepID=UPI00381118EF